MKTPLRLEHCQHVEVFESITGMVRAFAGLATKGDPVALDALNKHMQSGSVVRITIAVGSAGPLGLLFQRVELDGSTVDLLTIDAPPTAVPFHFCQGEVRP